MSQALSPSSLSRKPVDGGGRNMSNEENKYRFTDEDDTTPNPSTRNTMNLDPGVDSLEMDPQVKLENYDWAELEDQFSKRMEAFRAEEDGIWEEWKGWGEVFKAWASTISVHDEERAAKRLRTRIAFTQGSEESLEAKRQHYIKVVQAFESALQLLGSRNSAHNFI
ncbi:uncharacterized protein KY384_004184 [Bacidia gigantensis]|uniref:uncharacterized protein n=1 Tax=Bacidia gigantensis TaxID=2732470 RepID=UPI001D053276|nr:uncharacterized protein KY384_004184 [Bacidia gigantensis]KAG8530827.1 hypothetical protein KY384_004184 [Bacidia gigantensis]